MDDKTNASDLTKRSDDKSNVQQSPKSSGIALPSRIGRPCLVHSDRKPSLPSLESKQKVANQRPFNGSFNSKYTEPKVNCHPETRTMFLPLTKTMNDERRLSNGSLRTDLYWEATGRRRNSDHGAVLTADTDSFIIGQRVWVGGIKPGQIVYIGETHFAPGEWAGIVLDEPNGKNDGCVAGKRYFQCEPKKGIFSRLTRLTHQPLSEVSSPKDMSPVSTSRIQASPDRSRTVSPTSSIRSHTYRNVGRFGITVGDRVIVSSGFGSRPGILKYIGETKFAEGNWCGVQLDDPTGKNDGAVDGTRYFECPPKHGIFVPIAKVSLSPTVKKSRHSKTGSRESLTSVGTLNSIATTNTSRLRMSSQKLPTPLPKTVSSQRSNYSLQDVIREKQNHIEQLMIERELDREDAQNQALTFQKTISELQNRINEVESQLKDEKKKSDDLQYSVDEATFCGDELNAQTQVYREKITELENELVTLKLNIQSGDGSKEVGATIIQKNEELPESILKSEECLKEEIKLLLKRITQLEEKLISNEEMKEKLSLNIRELQIENLALLKKVESEDISQKDGCNTDIENKITKRDDQISQLQNPVHALQSENILLKRNLENLEKEFSEFKSQKEFEMNEMILKTSSLETALAEEKEQNVKNKDNYQAIIQELQSKLDIVQAALDSKIASLQTNDSKFNKSCIQISQLENTLLDKQAQIDRVVENFKNQTEQLQTEIINIKKEKLESLEKKEAEVQIAVEKQKQLEIELDAGKAETVKLLEYYKNELMAAKHQIENLEQLVNEKNQCIETLENFEKKVKSDSEELKELKTKLTTQEQIFIKNSELYENKIKSLSAEIEIFKTKVSERDADLKTLEENMAALQLTKEQNKNLSKECEEIKKLCSSKEEHISHLNLEMNNLSKNCDTLSKMNNEYKNRNESLLQELSNIKHSSTDVDAELIRITEALAHKEMAFIQLMESSNKKIMDLENELQTTRYSLNSSVEKIEQLQLEVKTEICAREDLQTKCKGLGDTIQSCEACIEEKEALIQSEKNKNIELENKHSELQTCAANLKSEIDNKNSEIENLTKQTACMEETNKIIAESLNKTEEDFKRLSTSCDDMKIVLATQKSEIESYKDQLKVKDEEQVDFVVKIHDLEKHISVSEQEKAKLNEQYNLLQESLEDVTRIQTKFHESCEQNDNLKKQLSMEQEQYKLMKIDLENLKQENSEIKNTKNEYEKIISNMEIMLTKQQLLHQEECTQLKRSLSDYKDALSQMKKTNSELKNVLLQIENNKPNEETNDKGGAIILKLENEIKHLKDKVQQKESEAHPHVPIPDVGENDPMAQINFLNSIIADMQKKNDTLKAKIDSLESFSTDFAQSLMDLGAKRKPAARMFCDICDVFDAHETEDCPLQDSDSPPPNCSEGEKTIPPPRKYCATCEVFGHDSSECADDVTY